ncbi:hypothetical protein CR513_50422, partial [Mucuna pruriens]
MQLLLDLELSLVASYPVDYFFNHHPLITNSLYRLTMMWIRPQILIIIGLPQDIVFLLVLILYYNVPRNNFLLPNLVLRSKLSWIQSFLNELGVPFTTLSIYCDNLSIASLSYNPVLHCHTKHMKLNSSSSHNSFTL